VKVNGHVCKLHVQEDLGHERIFVSLVSSSFSHNLRVRLSSPCTIFRYGLLSNHRNTHPVHYLTVSLLPVSTRSTACGYRSNRTQPLLSRRHTKQIHSSHARQGQPFFKRQEDVQRSGIRRTSYHESFHKPAIPEGVVVYHYLGTVDHLQGNPVPYSSTQALTYIKSSDQIMIR